LVDALQETVCVGLGCLKLGKEKEAGSENDKDKNDNKKMVRTAGEA
jgi:hypothetical protein